MTEHSGLIWLLYTFTIISAVLVIALIQARSADRTLARVHDMLKGPQS